MHFVPNKFSLYIFDLVFNIIQCQKPTDACIPQISLKM